MYTIDYYKNNILTCFPLLPKVRRAKKFSLFVRNEHLLLLREMMKSHSNDGEVFDLKEHLEDENILFSLIKSRQTHGYLFLQDSASLSKQDRECLIQAITIMNEQRSHPMHWQWLSSIGREKPPIVAVQENLMPIFSLTHPTDSSVGEEEVLMDLEQKESLSINGQASLLAAVDYCLFSIKNGFKIERFLTHEQKEILKIDGI